MFVATDVRAQSAFEELISLIRDGELDGFAKTTDLCANVELNLWSRSSEARTEMLRSCDHIQITI